MTRQKNRKNERGFTMMELLVASIVLVTGILGGMVMIIMGVARDNANRVDTTATNAAQTVLEQIASAPPNSAGTITLTDCLQNTFSLKTATGGAQLTSTGDIDFTQTQTSVPTGYQINYTVCGTNGLTTVYDIRWNISTVQTTNLGTLVTVSARQPFVAGQHGIAGITPVTLRTVVGI